MSRRQNPLIMDVPDGRLADLLNESLLETYKPDPNPFV
jgi:ferredoxin-nitrite reductase